MLLKAAALWNLLRTGQFVQSLPDPFMQLGIALPGPSLCVQSTCFWIIESGRACCLAPKLFRKHRNHQLSTSCGEPSTNNLAGKLVPVGTERCLLLTSSPLKIAGAVARWRELSGACLQVGGRAAHCV